MLSIKSKLSEKVDQLRQQSGLAILGGGHASALKYEEEKGSLQEEQKDELIIPGIAKEGVKIAKSDSIASQ